MKPIINSDNDRIKELIAQKLKKLITPPCQRILFIQPPNITEEDFLIEKALNKRYWSYQPYGCGLLCQNLEDRGYKTDILDLNLEILRFAHEARESFRYSFWEEILIDTLKTFKPKVVGLSCMFTMSHDSIKKIARKIKEYDKGLVVMGGGVHLSNTKKLALEDCTDIDFISAYECDQSLPNLIDYINGKLDLEKLSQIATLIDGQLVSIESRATPNSNEIEAVPLYHDLPVGEYSSFGQIGTYNFMWSGKNAASVLSNRGCRANCSFCSVSSFNGRGVRKRSIKSVVDEIQQLKEVHNIQHITWLDDDLLYDKKRAIALFNEITRRNLNITWDASNGLIVAAITPEIMQAMSESGCIGFNLGIESGNPEILRRVHKPGTVDSFRKAREIIEPYPHIFIKGFLIIGFPHETLGQIMDTVNLSLELSFDWYAIQLLNPLPSTEIYYKMIEDGLIQDRLETSNVAYVFGPQNRQRLREEREKLSASEFFNLFNISSLDSVPTTEQLGDYWFLMDYKLNYEKILGIEDLDRVNKIGRMLRDIADRIAPENPMAQLFYGIVEKRNGNHEEANKRAEIAKDIIYTSDYWRKRFEVLELTDLVLSLK